MQKKFDFDLFVIGGGSGGVRAARWSATLGAKVGICEEDRYGGTCVIRGCIPKKLMVYASEFSHEEEGARPYGWTTKGLSFNWSQLKKSVDQEVERLSQIYQNLLKNKNVENVKHESNTRLRQIQTELAQTDSYRFFFYHIQSIH